MYVCHCMYDYSVIKGERVREGERMEGEEGENK
jgi:hypothetical protein